MGGFGVDFLLPMHKCYAQQLEIARKCRVSVKIGLLLRAAVTGDGELYNRT